MAAVIEASWGWAILEISDLATRTVADLGFQEMARVRAQLSPFQIDLSGFREVVGAPADDALPVSTTATEAMVLAREAKASVASLQRQMEVMLDGEATRAAGDRARTLEMEALCATAAEHERHTIIAQKALTASQAEVAVERT